MLKRLKKLLAVTLVSAMSLANVIPVFATTTTTTTTPVVPAAIKTANYDVGTGVLKITGTNLVADKTLNLKDVSISDGLENTYTLATTASSKNATQTTSTAITVQLNAADMTALAKILDNCTTMTGLDAVTGNPITTTTQGAIQAKNGNNYYVNFAKGWDGATSATVANLSLTVYDVVGLTSAAYSCSAGTLTITGTNLRASTSIIPKDLTITDATTNSYTLTSPKSSSSTITLNAADKIALKGIFSANTTSTSGAINRYYLNATFGWDGPTSIGLVSDPNSDLANLGMNYLCPITVTSFAPPVISGPTATSKQTVVIGSPLTGITTDTPGTIYAITTTSALTLGLDPADPTLITSITKDVLDSLVTKGTALSVAATAKKLSNLSIPTKGTSSVPIAFKFATNTDNYDLVEMSDGGKLSNVVTKAFIINNVAAPALTATAATGTAGGTTAVSVTSPLAATTDTLAYEFSTLTIPTPKVGLQVTTPSAITTTPSALTFYTLTSGHDISGVGAGGTSADKYLGIYELNATNQVVKFKLLTLTAAKIKAPTISGATVNGTTLTLATTALLSSTNTPAGTAFKVTDGTKAIAVNSVAITTGTTGSAIALTLATAPLSGDTITLKYTKPGSSYLQDNGGNAVASITTAMAVTNNTPLKVIDTAAIAGVTAPVKGATGVTTITATDEYTGTVSWSPASTFAASTPYTATITLAPKAGYTLTGVAASFFTVSGATVTYAAGSSTITAVFPATGS